MKLVDKMCKYEMDPASIVEDTDGQTDQVKSVYHPFNFVKAEGITIWKHDIDACDLGHTLCSCYIYLTSMVSLNWQSQLQLMP